MTLTRSKHPACLICKNKELIKSGAYYKQCGLVKCSSCGFVFMESVPSDEELNSHYSQYSYANTSTISPLTVKSYNLLLDEFEKYRKTNKILDVGCGRGWFLMEARKRNWDVYGTEYSETAVEICNKNGIAMRLGELTADSFTSDEFDVITSFEVLEHINNPRDILAYINSFLRKDGMFYCTTPNFNSVLRYYLKTAYNIIEYPEHLSYYSKSTLNKVIEEQGFKNIKFLSTGISITRLNASKNTSEKDPTPGNSADEILRQRINNKWYLMKAKQAVDFLLTKLNLGMTLKGYYLKS